ncbi:hypothetical protein EYF80_036737 [Liparis tanakae]|uniref:Uncharacterized protein n=1 Tax=Liparis tanakae TaxID=230148 RepID=A0A4Z2GJR5_9TELE|nr:hypothetical protein EYF80_036737 [Liparis tanakae]
MARETFNTSSGSWMHLKERETETCASSTEKIMFLKMDDSGQSYMGGWRVQSLSPSHGSASWGAARRRAPTGGRAKGIPRYCFTRLSVPLAVTYWPLIGPFFRESTGSTLPADDAPMCVQVSGADCSARAPLEVAPRFSDSTRGRVGGPGDESSQKTIAAAPLAAAELSVFSSVIMF